MIVERALHLAGPGSVLAARPTGVAHVYTGPLTPSGRFIPRAGRVVCRARTRRLRVVTTPECWSSLSPQGEVGPLCARCSACLERHRPVVSRRTVDDLPSGQAGHHPHRSTYIETFRGMTLADLYVAAHCAVTTDEVDQVAHLSLILHGHRACTQPTRLPSGRATQSVHDAIARRRSEHPHPDITYRHAAAERAAAIRADRANQYKAARERERAPRINETGAPL